MVSKAEPYYNTSQLIFVSFAGLLIYGTFLMGQTVRHRNYFIVAGDKEKPVNPPTLKNFSKSRLLIVCLEVVVFMGKTLSPAIEGLVAKMALLKL